MTSFGRRRFLKITVASSVAAIAPLGINSSASESVVWNGVVLGADASIKVHGEKADANFAIMTALKVIKEQEKQLSIYDPDSSLSFLNKTGFIQVEKTKGASLHRLAVQSKIINQNTHGLFDPTVQPLFEVYAKANGTPAQASLEKARALVGVHKVTTSNASKLIFKQKGMALTFNGIAQGFITDKVRQLLNEYGYEHALINIGEYSVGTDFAKIGIADTSGEVFDIASLRNQAIATSSPSGYRFPDGTSHILHPNGNRLLAKWDTVSVIAKNATLADGYSTALALTHDTKLAEKLVTDHIIQRAVFKDKSGRVHRVD